MTTRREVQEAEKAAAQQREALAARPKPCVDCPGSSSLMCCGRLKGRNMAAAAREGA